MTTVKKLLLFIPLALSIGAIQVHAGTLPVPALPFVQQEAEKIQPIAERTLSLTNRYANTAINDVFANNILLTLAYLSGTVSNSQHINWAEVQKPQKHEIVLQPGEVFAYHDSVAPEFADKTVATTRSHFNAAQGFLSSGYLYGDGVCHLASIINQVARDAGLGVTARVNHDFAKIPDVPREFGTSIYYDPTNEATSMAQNLYVENTYNKPVVIEIDSNKEKVVVRVAFKN